MRRGAADGRGRVAPSRAHVARPPAPSRGTTRRRPVARSRRRGAVGRRRWAVDPRGATAPSQALADARRRGCRAWCRRRRRVVGGAVARGVVGAVGLSAELSRAVSSAPSGWVVGRGRPTPCAVPARHGTGMPWHRHATAWHRHATARHGTGRHGTACPQQARRLRESCTAYTILVRAESPRACTILVDRGRAAAADRRARKSRTLEPQRSACTRVPWTRTAAATGRRPRASWTRGRGAAAAAGRRARKSWMLDTGAAEVGVHEPRGRAAAAAGRRERVDAGAAEVGVHGSRGRWSRGGRHARASWTRAAAAADRRAREVVDAGASGGAVGRRRRAIGPRGATAPRARALVDARSCWSATPVGPAVRRRRGPGRWPARGAVGRRHRPLARAVRRCRGPGRWPARGAVGRRHRAVGPRGATAPRARALAGARSCWSATPAVGPRGATAPRARALAGARSCWSAKTILGPPAQEAEDIAEVGPSLEPCSCF